MKHLFYLIIVFSITLNSSCNVKEIATSIEDTTKTNKLVSIQVTPSSANIATGTKQLFTAIGIYSDNTTKDITNSVNWISSNDTVSSNDEQIGGLFHGISAGTSFISASINGVESNIVKLTVTLAELTSIQVTPVSDFIPLGINKQMLATGFFSDGTTQDITNSVSWQTDENNDIASIDNNGVITTNSVGDINIVASMDGITSNVATLVITGASLVSIEISTSSPTPIAVGLTKEYLAIGKYSDGTTQNLTDLVIWTSSNSSVATVTKGVVSAISAGETGISTQYNSITSNTLILESTNASILTISINPNSTSIAKGLVKQFTAIAAYSDGSSINVTNLVTWYSTNIDIATIGNSQNYKGLSTGVNVGTTLIYAIMDGCISDYSTLTVSTATLIDMTVTPENYSKINAGTLQQFSSIGRYSDGTSQDITKMVTWDSSNKSIMQISNNITDKGLASSISSGETFISASFSGFYKQLTVTVIAPISITIYGGPNFRGYPSIVLGETANYSAVALFADNSTKLITYNCNWNSSNNLAVTINSVGVVTSIGTGNNITITCTWSKVTSSKAIRHSNILLDGPKGLAIDRNNNLYISEGEIQKVNLNTLWPVYTSNRPPSGGWPIFGYGEYPNYSFMNQPYSTAIDDTGSYIYVADTWNHRILKYDLNGFYLTQWGGQAPSVNGACSPGNGLFCFPKYITIDSSGNIYVANVNVIQKFNPNGVFLSQWSIPNNDVIHGGITVDTNSKIYVGGFSLYKFDLNGNLLSTIKKMPLPNVLEDFLGNYRTAIDNNGNIYVVEQDNHRLLKLNPSGLILYQIGSSGSNNNQFYQPDGIVVNNGFIYVADTGNSRIQKFDLSGNYITQIGTAP